MEQAGHVVIGVDPHKLSATIEVVDGRERKFGRGRFATDRAGYAAMVKYAKAWPDIKVNAADPGYTATDFNGHSGPQTVTEGTDATVAMATIGADGPTGTFTDRHGDVGW